MYGRVRKTWGAWGALRLKAYQANEASSVPIYVLVNLVSGRAKGLYADALAVE